eukprot:c25587_g1_i2 orf=567-1547(+)
MGAPKQKWTAEEEAALRAGVEKYGAGKWRNIQKDAEFGRCLSSRSNVDLKDKWRNMSVSANGLGSRDRGSRALLLRTSSSTSRQAGTEAHMLSASGPESKAIVPCLAPVKDRKSSKPRYDSLIIEAILSLSEPNGSGKNQIASYIEDHHPVPSNFRSILNQKLKFLTLQGKLLKLRQNYMISDASKFFTEEKPLKSLPQKGTQYKQQDMDTKWQDVEDKWTSRIPRDPPKKMRRDAGSSRLKTGLDFTRLRTMTATEAASIAAEAVAEAEAAAVAAEEAAKVAELAEAEWEAAEAAAEAAATFARKCPKKSIRALAMGQEEAAVSG